MGESLRKWSFVLGLGIGIALMSLIMFLMQGAATQAQQQALMAFLEDNEIRINEAMEELMEELIGELAQDSAETLSQDEIISAAMDLGMMFEAQPDITQPAEASEEIDEDEDEVVVQQAPTPQPASSPPPAAVNLAEILPQGENVVLDIQPGSSATSISLVLQQNGLINNQQEFLSFLIENEADGLLGSGRYEIVRGSTFEEILEILVE